VSEKEHEKLEKLANEEGLTINDFIRVKLLKFKPSKRKAKSVCEEKKKLLYEIHKIGVNLNQIAKLVNWLVKEEIPAEESLEHLERIANALEDIDQNLNLILLEAIRGKR
jgi:flagellar biosynthesis component FlhA